MKKVTDRIDDMNWLVQQTQTLAKRSGIDPETIGQMSDKQNFCFLMGKLEGLTEGIKHLREIADNGILENS